MRKIIGNLRKINQTQDENKSQEMLVISQEKCAVMNSNLNKRVKPTISKPNLDIVY